MDTGLIFSAYTLVFRRALLTLSFATAVTLLHATSRPQDA